MTTALRRPDFPSWASNFFRSPLEWEGLVYNDVESAFQSAKTTDRQARAAFTADVLDNPGKAKQMGRALTLRPNWERIKDDVMLDILRTKFQSGGRLGHLLMTHTAPLVEWTMWHDNYWGVCLCERTMCHGGRNRLGSLLVQRRAELHGAVEQPGRDVPLVPLTPEGGPIYLHADMAAGRGDEDWVRYFAGERA